MKNVIVIGAGIGGLAAAIGLRRAGHEVQVFERAPELREVGAGLALWPNALRALDWLGIADTVRRLAVPDVVGGIRDWRGELLMAASGAEVQTRFGEPGLILHRAELQSILLDAAGSGTVRLGAQCVGFEQDPDGVTVKLADGQSVRGDVLIGADGLHSVVRGQLHGRRPPTYSGYTAWRGVVTFDHRRLQPGESWGHGTRFGQAPLSQSRVYWYATKTTPEGGRSPDGEKAELRRTFKGWHSPIEDLIEATDDSAVLRNDICDRPVLQRWGVGRVTLLGDAAHPMTPNLGQGGCQALEDAVVLARCLADGDAPAALRAYEARRISRANPIVRLSRQAGWLAQWQNPLAVWLRVGLVRLLVPRLQNRQIEQIVGYDVGKDALVGVQNNLFS